MYTTSEGVIRIQAILLQLLLLKQRALTVPVNGLEVLCAYIGRLERREFYILRTYCMEMHRTRDAIGCSEDGRGLLHNLFLVHQ